MSLAPSASPKSFGHAGFTGTFVWADPEHELVFVFLSLLFLGLLFHYPRAFDLLLIFVGISSAAHVSAVADAACSSIHFFFLELRLRTISGRFMLLLLFL